MENFTKILKRRHRSKKYEGVFYREVEKTTVDEHGRLKTSIVDKVYMIRWSEHGKDRWKTIGRYSAGIREVYAYQKRTEIVNKLNLGEEPPAIAARKRKPKGPTLDEVVSYYLKNKDMTERSRKDFAGRYRKHLQGLIGERPVSDLSAEEIIEAREKVEGSAKTKEILIQILSAAFNFAVVHTEYQHLVNPIERVRALDRANLSRASRKEKRRRREEYLRRDEIEQLRKALKDDFLSLLTVELLLSTGTRISSALALQKKHIDMDRGAIQLTDFKGGGEIYTGYISKNLRPLLERHLPGLGRNDYVLSRDGTPTPYKRIMRPIKKVMDRLFNEGLDPKDSENRIVIHSLRHTFASHLAMANVPLYTIKELLNHADIAMTMRYAKLSQETGQNAIKRLGL